MYYPNTRNIYLLFANCQQKFRSLLESSRIFTLVILHVITLFLLFCFRHNPFNISVFLRFLFWFLLVPFCFVFVFKLSFFGCLLWKFYFLGSVFATVASHSLQILETYTKKNTLLVTH